MNLFSLSIYLMILLDFIQNLTKFNLYSAGIRLGEFDSETDIDCDYRTCAEPVQDFYPVRILVHKDYGNPSFKNDIALIKLDRNVEYNCKFAKVS